jgi:hypothetical protein
MRHAAQITKECRNRAKRKWNQVRRSFSLHPTIRNMNSTVPSNDDSARDSTPTQRDTTKTNATLQRSVISQKKHEKPMERQANAMIAKADDASNIVIA